MLLYACWQVLLGATDSCPISVVDLKGSWSNSFQKVQIGSNGIGVWDNNARPKFSAAATDVCSTFDLSFPDDATYRAVLSDDKMKLSFLDGNSWTKTSNDGPPLTWDNTCSLFHSCTCVESCHPHLHGTA